MARTDRFRVLGTLGPALALLVSTSACSVAGEGWLKASLARPDPPSLAPYVVTPRDVVEEMLRMAGVRKGDLVYDLGSGDGRIVIEAARRYGARGVGIELDPELVRRARENAQRANVSHLVEFRQQDVLTLDLSPATVVTLYLSREANLKLRPHLLSQLRPGARVVSHEFDMGDWQPSASLRLWDESSGFRMLYLWRIESGRPGGEEKGLRHREPQDEGAAPRHPARAAAPPRQRAPNAGFSLTPMAELTGSYDDSSEGVAPGLRPCSVRMASIASAACRPASGARCP